MFFEHPQNHKKDVCHGCFTTLFESKHASSYQYARFVFDKFALCFFFRDLMMLHEVNPLQKNPKGGSKPGKSSAEVANNFDFRLVKCFMV